MLKVDGVEHSYVKAVNALNFDKLGHPDGSGSWGIVFTILDNFHSPMLVYIGLKFDVISIYTSRFISTGFNMEARHKDLIGGVRRRVDLDFSQVNTDVYDIETALGDNFYVVYLDIHKIEIDVVELAKTIYQKPADITQYINISREKVFKTQRKRSARAISAQMLRQYEGNMETFSTVFSESENFSIINGLILDDALISDEIKYTVWLTPHDLNESSFHETGDITYEENDDYIEGLGGGHVLGDIMTPLFTSDRRGFRNGYLDVSAENPVVNHGYTNGGISMFDTYMWGDSTINTPHRHESVITVNSQYYNSCPKRLSSLSVFPGTVMVAVIEGIQDNNVKKILIEQIAGTGGESIGRINNLIQDVFVDEALDSIGDKEKVDISSIYIQQCKDHMRDTLVAPLSIHNILVDLSSVDATEVKDSIVFIHHPVLNKTIFIDMNISDMVEISSSSVVFKVDDLEYGYRINGGDGEFYWAGVTKPFRYNDDIWMNLKGNVYNKGFVPFVSPMLPEWEKLAIRTDSKVYVSNDLEYDGDYGTIMAVRKNDFIDIIRKRIGVVSSEYIFGIPGGNITIPRTSIWM